MKAALVLGILALTSAVVVHGSARSDDGADGAYGDRLHLDETEHFATPLARARVEQRKKDAVLVLELKHPIDSVQVHVQPGQDGYFFVFVELPRSE